MIFGRGHRTTRRQVATACGWLLSAMLLMSVVGCGGGGSGDGGGGGNNGGGTPAKVTIIGRVIDIYNSGNAVQGAQFTYNGSTFLTNANGDFSAQVDASTVQVSAQVVGPTLSNGQPGYHGQGTVSTLGSTVWNLNTTGFPVNPTAAGETVNVGTIRIGNVEGPPFPPF